MTASLAASDTPESSNGHRTPNSGHPLSLATRHMCAMTHMRNSMLSDASFESSPLDPPRSRMVGRAYALRVLIDQQRTGPMPGVNIEAVKHECQRAIQQTLIRDVIAVGLIFAHRQVLVDGKWLALNVPGPQENGNYPPTSSHQNYSHEAFTSGLPKLDVNEVIAVPAPRIVSRPLWWLVIRRLTSITFKHTRTRPLDKESGLVHQNWRSAFPPRRYIRASTSTWDGELVASIYVGATLQAHYLRLIIRPYLLAPMVPDLRQIEFMIDRNRFMQLNMAITGTARSLFRAVLAAHNLGRRHRKRVAPSSSRSKLLSTREHYAMDDTDSVHDAEDARRTFQVMSMKVFDATETYLADHNIDTEDYMNQIKVFMQKGIVITGGDNSGNFSVGDNSNQRQGPSGDSGGGNKDGK